MRTCLIAADIMQVVLRKNIGDIKKALEEGMKFQIDWKFNLSGQGKDLMATLEVIRGPSW